MSSPSLKPKYVMPVAQIGPCLWYATKGTEAIPATITQVGAGSVMLTVWAPDNRAGLPKDGVRHVSDPIVAEYPTYEAGCWDYTADAKYLAAVKQRLDAVESAVDELEKQGTELRKALGEPLEV